MSSGRDSANRTLEACCIGSVTFIVMIVRLQKHPHWLFFNDGLLEVAQVIGGFGAAPFGQSLLQKAFR
jgi:hypothetical protein